MTPFEWIMVITAVMSAAAGGYSAVASGNAQRAAAEAQAEQEAENAKIAQQQANQAVDKGQAQKDAIRLKLAEMRAQGRTGYAAGNVALGSGTPSDFESDLAYRTQMDLDQIDTNTDLEVWGHLVQSTTAQNNAAAMMSKGNNAQTAGYWSGASSLLSGASQVAGMYKPGTSTSFNVGGAKGTSTGTGGGYNMGGGRVSGL